MTRALSADVARKTQLEDCEVKIKSAFRRGLEATCAIAKQLHIIYSQELYTVRTPNWNEYVTIHQRMDLRTYRRIIAVSQTVHQLQEAGLALPVNETQVAELSRLDAPLRARVWNDLVIQAEKEDKLLTTEDVRRAVEIAVQAIPSDSRGPSDADVEVEVDLEDDANGDEPPPAKTKAKVQDAILVLTEKGEAALSRIKKVCGDEIAKAISNGTKAMTERDLRNWAEFDDDMMRQLVFFIFDQNFPVTRAVNFVTREISDDTDVHDLILIASSRGGSAVINYDNRAKIEVKLKTAK